MNKERIITDYVKTRNGKILQILRESSEPISAKQIVACDKDLSINEICSLFKKKKPEKYCFNYNFEKELNNELRREIYTYPKDVCNKYFFTAKGQLVAKQQDQTKRQEIIKNLITDYNNNIIKNIDNNNKKIMKSGTIEYYADNISCLLYSLKAFDNFNIKNIIDNPFDKKQQLIYALTLCKKINILNVQKLPTRYWIQKIEIPNVPQQETIIKTQHTETKVKNVCPKCNFVIDQDFTYCPKCGTFLK